MKTSAPDRSVLTFSIIAVVLLLSRKAVGSQEKGGYVFIILNQPNARHSAVAHLLADDIADQAKQLSLKCHIHIAEQDWPNTAVWTYFPILERVQQLHRENSSWIIVLEEWSQLRLKNLQDLLAKYDSSERVFLGNGIHDDTETIIHHFALVDENRPFLFPDTRAGLVLSTALVLSLAERWSDFSLRPKMDFTIDAQYEFASFVESDGVVLIHLNDFCLEDSVSCAVIFSPRQTCLGQLETEDIHFAVKTCSNFHLERLPILKETWLKHASNYVLYSDFEDPAVGTISLGIPNTERGHCGKTMAIIRYAAQHQSVVWLAVVDDDTLLSVPRLKSLLSCYNPKDLVAIGERYGFHAIGPYGYDYITGGGGMIFSGALAKRLGEPGVCECPTNDTPDDMFLGVCLKRLSVPIVHSRGFHQSRPMDYPEQLLRLEQPVSFHKYWMISPHEVYSDWLDTSDNTGNHDEL